MTDAVADRDRRLTVGRDGHVLVLGLDRVDKRNAADVAMLEQLALAYGELDRDPALRCAVVHAQGDHFSAGLDLADVAPRLGAEGLDVVPDGGLDPWQVHGRRVAKPVVIAVQGVCFTLGIELILASDIAVAGTTARFAQLEVTRGILPFGGATTRFPARAGWGDAMRWMLTGDEFDAREALRIGLVQEVVDGDPFDRALELAHRIAAQAPLAVQATLRNARLAVDEGVAAAEAELGPALGRLAATEDAAEGMSAFARRATPDFRGR